MNIFSRFRGLDKEGLTQVAKSLDEQERMASLYDAFNHIPEGQFLINELKKRKELARNLYASIDPSSEQALFLLNTLQSYEREADEWLGRITNVHGRLAELQQAKVELTQIIEEKKEMTVRKDRMSFVPTGRKKKD